MTFIGDTGGSGSAFGALSWNPTGVPGTTSTRYLIPSEVGPDAAEYFQLAAGPGTYTSLAVVATVALATDSVTYTVRKNGVDTALTVTVAAGATSAVGSGSVAVVAGDRISIKVVQSGTETTTTRIGVGLY